MNNVNVEGDIRKKDFPDKTKLNVVGAGKTCPIIFKVNAKINKLQLLFP